MQEILFPFWFNGTNKPKGELYETKRSKGHPERTGKELAK